MTDLNTIRNSSVSYKNVNLRKATESIYALADSMRKSAYQSAYIIAQVNREKWYKDDGFESVHAWTESAFGFKKSQSYAMLKIGDEWTATVRNEKGKVIGYRSRLTDENAPIDYNTTQIGLLLPLGEAEARALTDEGTVSPSMTCQEIKRVLRDRKGADDTDTDESDGESAESATTGKSKDKPVIRVRDSWGTIYDVPANVLKKYAVTPIDVSKPDDSKTQLELWAEAAKNRSKSKSKPASKSKSKPDVIEIQA